MRVLLKREDLTHTGSHKINNVLGQALLTRRMGKQRVIAETGAGQHGVATATAAALFGLDCLVFMGAVDVERQALNVFRMQLLGAEVVPGHRRQRHAQGRDQRGAARLGGDGRDARTTASARSSARTRTRGWCASSSASSATRRASSAARSSAATTPTSWSRASAAARTRSARSPASSTPTRRPRRRRGRRPRARVGPARRVGEPRRARRAARRPLALPPGRGRPDPRGALDQRRPRLPGRRARARAARGRRVGPRYESATDDEASPGSSCCRSPRASCPRSSRRTRSAGSPARPGARCRAGSTVLVTLSGRGDKDAAQVAERLTGERLVSGRREPRVAPARPPRRGPQAPRAVRHRRARIGLARRRAGHRRRRRRRDRDRHPVLRPGDGRPHDPGGVAARARPRRDAGRASSPTPPRSTSTCRSS